jgi:signal transduction histidine kinase
MASLGHLVAGVAHELNTPIGNALTTASVLRSANQDLKAAMVDGTMRKSTLEDFIENALLMSDIVSRSCQRAASLISSFKQVAADQTSEQRRHFNLHSLVEDNIAALCAGISQRNWQIAIHVPSNIKCDSYPGPLGQVIANLVQNAATHAFKVHNNGTLTIHVSQLGTAPDEIVEMRFSDDGVGMNEETLAHIFEPFYTTHTGQGGPGLGLSIALNIVTGVLGGTLTASSTLASGTQFCLQFPLNAPDRITPEMIF